MVDQNIPLGIFIGLLSYSSLYAGKGIQKLAIEGIKEKHTIKSKHSGVWIIGTVLTALPVFIQWAALAFAPVNLVAPLEGFGLLVLLVFSFLVLKENIRPLQVIGAFCIIAGTVFVTLFSSRMEVPPLASFSFLPLIIIATALFAGEAIGILLSKMARYRFAGPIIGFTAGTMMAFQTFSKRLSILSGISWQSTAAVFIFAILTLLVTQFGFVKAKANEVVLAFTSGSILVASLLGSVVLRETLAGIQYGGMAVIIIGVFLLVLFRGGTGRDGPSRCRDRRYIDTDNRGPGGPWSKIKKGREVSMQQEQTEKTIYREKDADLSLLKEKTIAVIGYGNQGRAQALNMRDNRLSVIIGSEDDSSKRAWEDQFSVYTFSEAAKEADILFLLLPDEVIPSVYEESIKPNLKEGAVLCFASGYTVAFGSVAPPPNVDVIMIAPRMIGVGVRENYRNGQGFFSFICVHHDYTGNAHHILLALSKAIGTLKKGGITVSLKQEAVLDLYNEQAFGPAFGKVLLTSIDVLLKKGLPPEAVLIEMYLSGEMSYTYRKMAEVGIVNQLQFHSHTSQYGAMSRGVRYMDLPLREKFEKTYNEIESGSFAREWATPLSKLKLKVFRFFASKQKIGKVEREVREKLGLKVWDPKIDAAEVEKLLTDPKIKEDLGDFEGYPEY